MPLEFELRLSGYKKKTKQLVVTGNTVINVMLDRAPSPGNSGTRKGSGHKRGSGDELMNPDDL
jgi:hypothetical protein